MWFFSSQIPECSDLTAARLHAYWTLSAQRAIHQYIIQLDPTSPERLRISLLLASFTRDAFENQEAESARILQQALSEIRGLSPAFIADLPDDENDKREAINKILRQLESWEIPFKYHDDV